MGIGGLWEVGSIGRSSSLRREGLVVGMAFYVPGCLEI